MNTAKQEISHHNIHIAQASIKDIQLILNWTMALHQHEDDGTIKTHHNFSKNLEKWLEIEINNPNSLFLIALVNEIPAGFIASTVIINDNGFLSEPMKGLIQLLWVENKFRQQKIAESLLTEIETCLYSNGINYIECHYTQNNQLAKLFWGNNGYNANSITARKFLN